MTGWMSLAEYRQMMVRDMREREFQDLVVLEAKTAGWRVHHTRPARSERGWRTPIQGHRGFPDLALAREGVLLLAELKAEKGRLDAEQRAWFDAIEDGPERVLSGPHLWLPHDLDVIREMLR